MQMPNAKDYLIRIRKLLLPTDIIIVPNTQAYEKVIQELKDPYIQLKEKK